jgi:hypothetical protein
MKKDELIKLINNLNDNELIECCKYYLQDNLSIENLNNEYFSFDENLKKEQVDEHLMILVNDKEEYYQLLRFILLVGAENNSDEVEIALQGIGHKLDLTNPDTIVAVAGMSMLFIYKMYHLFLTKGVSKIDEEKKIEKTENGFQILYKKTLLNSKTQGGFSNFLSFLLNKNKVAKDEEKKRS